MGILSRLSLGRDGQLGVMHVGGSFQVTYRPSRSTCQRRIIDLDAQCSDKIDAQLKVRPDSGRLARGFSLPWTIEELSFYFLAMPLNTMLATSKTAQDIDGVQTEVLIQVFADRILVLVTQLGKVGNLV